MKLAEHAADLSGLGNKIDDFRLAQDRLAFCAEVFERYSEGRETANEHMDADKARRQLLDAVHCMLKV